MTEEILDLINEKNEAIGTAPRKEVERKGLLYRSSEIFVIAGGKIAVQLRSKNKTKRPEYYGIVGETVKSGETFEHAAARGVNEELGLEAVNLRQIGKRIVHDKKYNDNFLMNVFICTGRGEMKIDKAEVEEVVLMDENEVGTLIKSGKKVTPSLIEGFEMYRGHRT